MVVERYARPIYISVTSQAATNTDAIKRSTRLAFLSAKPTEADLHVTLKNAKTGAVVWKIEADDGAGSHFENFSPPLIFPDGINVHTEGGGTDSCVCLGVIEPL